MKTKNKHTPGPWKIEIHNGEPEIWSQNTFIAGVTHDLYFTAEKSGQYNANAALIAAAPEMFEAIEKLLSEPELPDHIANYLYPIFKKARGE